MYILQCGNRSIIYAVPPLPQSFCPFPSYSLLTSGWGSDSTASPGIIMHTNDWYQLEQSM